MPLAIGGSTPPTFQLDLGLPPRERYVEIAKEYSTKILGLPALFDELVPELVPFIPLPQIHTIARLFLRRVYTSEETEELRGISETVNVPMYLLVSYNVLLDLLLGCTSGGVRVREGRGSKQITKMLHFRTLDWGMDILRDLIVQLEFVNRKSSEPDRILATSITYVGQVGVLTGVREGLSLSLNFRPVHAAHTRLQNFNFYWNHLLVLLGFKSSISSRLRQYLLPLPSSHSQSKVPSTPPSFYTMSTILTHLLPLSSTAAYLIFSTGHETFTIEKDNHSARIRSSTSFIATTNHDADHETPEPPSQPSDHLNPEAIASVAPTTTKEFDRSALASPIILSLDEALRESQDRLSCLTRRWNNLLKANEGKDENLSITETELLKWIRSYPTTNECTHFACVMDAEAGRIRWIKSYAIGEAVKGKKGGKVSGRLERKKQDGDTGEGDAEWIELE